MYVTLLV